MPNKVKNKILLAVDGSDQALEAVRYAGAMMPAGQSQMVLFYVGTGFPEVFWDMDENPLYRSKKEWVMGWLANHQLTMGEFKEKAFKILADAGFGQEDVKVHTRVKRTGIFKDIIQETYQDYRAIVIGRTGNSRFNDLVFGGMARKLAAKIKHIPTVIVGGEPHTGKILIALDESIESMRGVSSVANLSGAANPEVTLCHCLIPKSFFRSHDEAEDIDADDIGWRTYRENRFRPYMEEAAQRLMAGSVSEDRISREFVPAKGSVIYKTIEMARKGDFGTVVVGRRGDVGLVDALIRGRFSDKIIESLGNCAVWVVS
jgi:nucleotide-binding universal stress UspA family protein